MFTFGDRLPSKFSHVGPRYGSSLLPRKALVFQRAPVKNTICDGVPTGVYCPVCVSAPVFRFTRIVTIASARWLQQYTHAPVGSNVKNRG